MRAHSHASPDDIDIVSVWTSIRRGLPRILVAGLLAGGLTYAILSLMAPRYMSEAQLAIVAKGAADPFKDPRNSGGPGDVSVRMDKEAINTHLLALQSQDLASKVVGELKLADKKEFNSALGSPDTLSYLLRFAGIGAPKKGESEQDRVLAAYFKQLEAYAPKESRSIVVRFTSIDPQLAAEVANRIAETYRASLATLTVSESDDVTKGLEPKIARLKEEVAAAEREVERFRGEANIFKAGQQSTGLNEQQLSELTAELSKAKAARSEAESRAKTAREMMRSGGAEVLPDVQKSPLIQNLVQQRVRLERQVSELSATLLPGHPRMQQVNADLAGLKKQIASEVGKVVDSLEKEAKVAALREESVNKSLSEIKTRVVTAAPDEAKLRNLEASAKAKRGELESLQAQYEAARVRSDSRALPVEAQVVAKARPSSVPSFPQKGPYSLLAGLAMALFGLAITMTKALLTGARQPVAPTPIREVASAAKPRPVAEPVLDRTASGTISESNGDRMTRITSIAELADHLEKHAPASGACRSMIVGELDTVDAAPEAIDLAKELAKQQRTVVVIDWCPTGAGIAAKIGMRRSPGINEILSGSAKFEDAIQSLPDTSVHFIASGDALSYVEHGPEPDQINLILDALDEAYGQIIVVGQHEPARALFELIEGRFDCGITVSDGKPRMAVLQDPPGTFLGYEVADMEIVQFQRKTGKVPAQRILRATGGAREEARQA